MESRQTGGKDIDSEDGMVTDSLFLGSFYHSFCSSFRHSENSSALVATAATGVPGFYFASTEFPNEPRIYLNSLLGE